jgi:hypothetical protein
MEGEGQRVERFGRRCTQQVKKQSDEGMSGEV